MTSVARADDAPTTITATHHLEELPAGTTHAALLNAGALVAAGPVEETLTDAVMSHAFGLSIKVDMDSGRWSARAAG
jgi:iron complex transport system ATP-binding protein